MFDTFAPNVDRKSDSTIRLIGYENTRQIMTSEFDLPCTECGGELQKTRLDPQEVGFQIETDATVLIAKCRSCGERHYPVQTLSRLEGRNSK